MVRCSHSLRTRSASNTTDLQSTINIDELDEQRRLLARDGDDEVDGTGHVAVKRARLVIASDNSDGDDEDDKDDNVDEVVVAKKKRKLEDSPEPGEHAYT